MKIFGWVVLGIILFFGLIAGGYAYKYFTAPIRGVVDAQQKIHDGSNRIQKYNHFFDLCARAQEVCSKLKAQYEQLEITKDNKQKQRIMTRITALKGEFQRCVRKYNADARKGYAMGQFRSSELPYQLPTTFKNQGECVSCENY